MMLLDLHCFASGFSVQQSQAAIRESILAIRLSYWSEAHGPIDVRAIDCDFLLCPPTSSSAPDVGADVRAARETTTSGAGAPDHAGAGARRTCGRLAR